MRIYLLIKKNLLNLDSNRVKMSEKILYWNVYKKTQLDNNNKDLTKYILTPFTWLAGMANHFFYVWNKYAVKRADRVVRPPR